MKLGIIGLAGAGKTTVFEALTREFSKSGSKSESRLGTIKVPDTRVDTLSSIYKPRKTIHAQVEYLLPGRTDQKNKDNRDDTSWAPVREADALIHVVRNFSLFGLESPDPFHDYQNIEQDMILIDLASIEKRLEKMDIDSKRGQKGDKEEYDLLKSCHDILEREEPLRHYPDLAWANKLRGYAFLSAKPQLLLFNNTDEDLTLPSDKIDMSKENPMVIRGKLEHELAQMSDDEAAELLEEFNISASATDRVIQQSYAIVGLISFFTVGEDEVRAWTIKKGTVAVDAAEVIHTDMKKGFIRAEVVAFEDLVDAGSIALAKKSGTFRLEGKTYEVCDGDVISFRFNV